MSTLSVRRFNAILFASILAVAPLSVASHADDLEGAVIVKVPFAFENGSQHLAPGLYTIRMESENISTIQGQSRSGFALTWLSEDRHPSTTTKVVFHRYSERYFLDQVWVAGETSHSYFLPSTAEKLEMAADRTTPTSVEVTALETPR
jgi:hypothetical protein